MPVQFKYKQGQVVWCLFPYQEQQQAKDRPGLILNTNDVNGNPYYAVAKMTKTNGLEFDPPLPGIWLLKDSPHGKSMRLDFDTFIDLKRVVLLPEFGIRRLMSICPCFDLVRQESIKIGRVI